MLIIPFQYAHDPTPACHLRFLDEAVIAKQSRFRNRRMLRPAIELDSYSCRAAIDFIDVDVHTINLTGMAAVRKWIMDSVKSESVFCWHLDGTMNSARSFTVRIQEPTATMLSKVERAIGCSRAGLARPTSIRTIEVSIDIYAKSGKQDDRDRMVGLLQRTYLPGMETWTTRVTPRFVVGDPSSTTHLIKHPPKNQCVYPCQLPPSPPLDSTTYFGEQDGPWMVRVQNKVTDRRSGTTARSLLDEEKRARIEVTLRGPELQKLGLVSLSRLSNFRFAGLQGKFFHFALPTFIDEPVLTQHSAVAAEVNRTDQECFCQGGVVCLERWRNLKEQWLSAKPLATTVKQSPLQRLRKDARVLGRSVQYRRAGTGRYGTTISYSELNEMVSSALRDLDRRTRF
jgi:hypothetical protein